LVAVNEFGALLVAYQREAGFTEPESGPVIDGGPIDVAACDFNGDRRPDLAVANILGTRAAALMRVPSDDGYAAPIYAEVGAGSGRVVTGDFTGDGHCDYAVSVLDTGSVAVIARRRSNIGFARPQLIRVGTTPLALGAADFDDDGDLDLLVADRDTGELRLLTNRTRRRAAAGH
jgi:hypothetical protein